MGARSPPTATDPEVIPRKDDRVWALALGSSGGAGSAGVGSSRGFLLRTIGSECGDDPDTGPEAALMPASPHPSDVWSFLLVLAASTPIPVRPSGIPGLHPGTGRFIRRSNAATAASTISSQVGRRSLSPVGSSPPSDPMESEHPPSYFFLSCWSFWRACFEAFACSSRAPTLDSMALTDWRPAFNLVSKFSTEVVSTRVFMMKLD